MDIGTSSLSKELYGALDLGPLPWVLITSSQVRRASARARPPPRPAPMRNFRMYGTFWASPVAVCRMPCVFSTRQRRLALDPSHLATCNEDPWEGGPSRGHRRAPSTANWCRCPSHTPQSAIVTSCGCCQRRLRQRRKSHTLTDPAIIQLHHQQRLLLLPLLLLLLSAADDSKESCCLPVLEPRALR